MSGIEAHSKEVSMAILKSLQVDKHAEWRARNNQIAAWQGTSSETQESTLHWKNLFVDSFNRLSHSLLFERQEGFQT
jgi:hypothetical protein